MSNVIFDKWSQLLPLFKSVQDNVLFNHRIEEIEDEREATPWTISCGIEEFDYLEILDKYGLRPIDDELIKRFNFVTGQESRIDTIKGFEECISIEYATPLTKIDQPEAGEIDYALLDRFGRVTCHELHTFSRRKELTRRHIEKYLFGTENTHNDIVYTGRGPSSSPLFL